MRTIYVIAQQPDRKAHKFLLPNTDNKAFEGSAQHKPDQLPIC